MLAEVGQNQEQSNNIEFLVDSGAVCHAAWPFMTKSGSSRGGTFLTATGYAGCDISIGGRTWCGTQCKGHVRIASCSQSNPECESC